MSKRSSIGLEEREHVAALLLCALVLLRTGSLLSGGSLVGAQALDHSVLRLTINFLSRLLLGLRWPIGGLVLLRRSVFGLLLLLSRRILVFFLLVIRVGLALISLLVVGIWLLGSLAAAVALRRSAVAAALAAFPAFVVPRGSASAPVAALGLGTAHVVTLLLLVTFVPGTIVSAGAPLLLTTASRLLLLVVHRAFDVGRSHRGLHRCSDTLNAIVIFLFMALNFEPFALHDLGRLVVGVDHCPMRASLGRMLRLRDLRHLACPCVSKLRRTATG